MYKLCFYVPEAALEQVKDAVFKVGAGRLGRYEHCCWQVLGEGQFKPLSGSKPFVGLENQLETIPEYRVELVCEDNIIESAVAALKSAHPYETPAFDVVKLSSF